MGEIKSLTSLRGIAALMVVMQHFSASFQTLCAVEIPSLVPHGYVAVDFFFVLSGYIMCYCYLEEFQKRGYKAFFPFLGKRLIRLLPLNFAVTSILFIAALLSINTLGRDIFLGGPVSLVDVLTNLFMLQGWGLGRNLNGPAWSVSAELGAYLLFPLLIYAAFSSRAFVVAVLSALAGSALVFVALSHTRLGLAAEDPVFGGLRCISEFTIGMLAYRLGTYDQWRRLFGTAGLAYFVAVGVLGLLLLRIDLLTALSFPFLVLVAANDRGGMDRFLSSAPLYFLGNISYSLYLVHNGLRPLAIEIVRSAHPESLGTAEALMLALLSSLLAIPVAWLSYRFVEWPSRSALRAWLVAPRGAQAGGV
jgi:peptidoglycan/LPS O-acetylase OafA/YrhL